MKLTGIVLFLLLIFQHSSAQNSWRIQIDTSAWHINYSPAFEITSDGGVLFGFFDRYVKVIKLDASLNLSWSKNYGLNPSGISYDRIEMISTNDTGFYLLAAAEEDMFSWFESPYLRKIDKNGNQTALCTANSGPFAWGNYLNLGAVDHNTNNLFIFGSSYGYDSYNDVVCCWSGYDVVCDSSLTILNKKIPLEGQNVKRMFYNSFNEPYFLQGNAQNLPVDSGFYHIYQFDTLRNQVWHRHFSYDTTQIREINVVDIAEFNSEWYILLEGKVDSKWQLCINKLDSQWNSIYCTVLDTSSFITQYKLFYSMDLEVNSGKIFISGIAMKSIFPPLQTSILIEADTSGTINYAWASSDSTYFNIVKIDTLSNSTLFSSVSFNSGTKFYHLERQFPSSPSCNYIPYPMNSIPLNILTNLVDSGAMAQNSSNPFLCL